MANIVRLTFKRVVFARDNYKCVFCDNDAQDAHHILERRLWKDGGYHIDNGASVCGHHHLECEKTNISVEGVREAAGITNTILPEHLYADQIYDKWGNIILQDGTRLRGELFYDDSVQLILKPLIHLFSDYVKYPRTYHLPWSDNMTSDDRMLDNMHTFTDKRVIVTEKLDGENTTMYSDYIHARSIDGNHHYSRDWVKNYWAQFSFNIPSQWRVCGENMFAEHSIHYNNLKSYFYGFSIWDESNMCLSWDETKEYFKLLELEIVPVLYDGIYDTKTIKNLYNDNKWNTSEGYVIRVADKFSYKDFRTCVAKYVRKNHVQTVKHWMHGRAIKQNELG